jgi:hypothetical protein
MHRAIELHDSQVESITTEGHRVIVRFSDAYVHESEGHPGLTPGDVLLQAAELVFSDVEALPRPHGKDTIAKGVVRVNESEFSLLPLPFEGQGEVHAQIEFSSGNHVDLHARSVHCAVTGKARWLDKFDG